MTSPKVGLGAIAAAAAFAALGCGASGERSNTQTPPASATTAEAPVLATKPRGPRCGSDEDCALARFDPATRACCSCSFVAILSIDQTAFQERCADADRPCVQSCLQNPKTRAVCVDGGCAVRP